MGQVGDTGRPGVVARARGRRDLALARDPGDDAGPLRHRSSGSQPADRLRRHRGCSASSEPPECSVMNDDRASRGSSGVKVSLPQRQWCSAAPASALLRTRTGSRCLAAACTPAQNAAAQTHVSTRRFTGQPPLNPEINKSEPQALTAGQDPAPLRRSNPGADENTPRSDLEMSVNSHPGLPLNWGSSRISLSAAVRSRRAARNPGSGVADPGASQSNPPSGARSAGSSRPRTPSAAPW